MRSSRARSTGPTVSWRRRSARSKCGAGNGSIPGPSLRRCARSTHPSVSESRPKALLRIRAGRVHPVTAPSFEDGAVLVDATGRIAAVGPNVQVPRPLRAQSLHFPDAELLPGLVNCHTHLELTHLGGGAQHREPEFLKWIRRIRELKERTSPEAFYEAAVAGVRDCWARGITCIAETGSTGAVMRALRDLAGLGVLQRGALCIHCVQVSPADVELLREAGATVAHCPRSNSAHRHGRMPLELFRKAGVPLGIGTDSVVSVGDLDLWAEAEAAGLAGEDALRALTIEGARALSWESEIGSLEMGKAADLAVFSLAAPRRPSPPPAAQLTVVSGRIVHQISAT